MDASCWFSCHGDLLACAMVFCCSRAGSCCSCCSRFSWREDLLACVMVAARGLGAVAHIAVDATGARTCWSLV